MGCRVGYQCSKTRLMVPRWRSGRQLQTRIKGNWSPPWLPFPSLRGSYREWGPPEEVVGGARKSEFGGGLGEQERDPLSQDRGTQTLFLPLEYIPSLGYTESEEEAGRRQGRGHCFLASLVGRAACSPLFSAVPPPPRPNPIWLLSVLRKPRPPFPLWKWLSPKRAVN